MTIQDGSLLSVSAEARRLVAPDCAIVDGMIEHTASAKAEALRWVTDSLDRLDDLSRVLEAAPDLHLPGVTCHVLRAAITLTVRTAVSWFS